MRWLALAGALLVPLLVGCLHASDEKQQESTKPAATPNQLQEEKIAFVDRPSIDGEVLVIDPDGTGLRQLTRVSPQRTCSPDSPCGAESPVFSPDGRLIAFTRQLQQQENRYQTTREVYVVSVEGNGEHRLTTNTTDELGIDWLPDGRIVFASCPQSQPGTDERPDCSLVAMRADGTGREELARLGSAAGLGGVSPDGRRVVYVEVEGQSHYQELELVVTDLDGSGRRELTDDDTGDSAPAWSPDGERIVFMSNRAESAPCDTHDCVGFKNELYVMDADGSDVTRLTDTPQEEFTPKWSPHGEKIVYSRERSDGPPDLYVMNADGSCPTRVVQGATPDWYGPPRAKGGLTATFRPFLDALRRVVC